MAMKGLIQLSFLFLLVFLSSCASSGGSRASRLPATADEQIIFSSALKVKSQDLVFDILIGMKEAEKGILYCDKDKNGLMLLKGDQIDLDLFKAKKSEWERHFFSFEGRGECAKFKEALGFIDSGAPLIINIDRERKKIITFFY